MRPRLALLLTPLLLAAVGCDQDYTLAKEARRLTVSPAVADLGVLAVGDHAEEALTLIHSAGPEIEILALDLLPLDGDAFTVGEELPVVSAGETAELRVGFAPESEGYFRSRLTIYTNEERGGEHEVELRGQAGTPTVEAIPSLLDFGPAEPGETLSLSLTLRNSGPVSWTLSELNFGLPVFDSGEALPVLVTPGEDLALELRFSPTDEDEAISTVAPTVSGADTPLVTLLGNACSVGDPTLYDQDGDGWTACAADCDDQDATAHPGGEEVCDGRDDDCDGDIDEGTLCADDDGDGYSENDGDCADADPDVSPSTTEVQDNGVDDDCDGVVDLGSEDPDGDGYSAEAGDCDGADATSFPGAAELADGADNDCDGVTDEGTSAYDDDSDGYTEDGGDCDDGDATVSPGDPETGDGVDDDCDGAVDEGTTWADDDGDGWSERGGDCDDGDASVNPGAVETAGDRVDNDCDGVSS